MPRKTRNSRKTRFEINKNKYKNKNNDDDPERLWKLVRQQKSATERTCALLQKWKTTDYYSIWLQLFYAKALLTAAQARVLVAHIVSNGGDWRAYHAVYPFVYERGKLTAKADSTGAFHYGPRSYADLYVWFEPGNCSDLSIYYVNT